MLLIKVEAGETKCIPQKLKWYVLLSLPIINLEVLSFLQLQSELVGWVFSRRRSYELTKFCPSCHRLSDEPKTVCLFVQGRQKGDDRGELPPPSPVFLDFHLFSLKYHPQNVKSHCKDLAFQWVGLQNLLQDPALS